MVSPFRLLVVVGMVYRAWSRSSLTPLGLIVAATSGIAQALHPWATPLTLLAVFYFGGTKVTKVCPSLVYAQLCLTPASEQTQYGNWAEADRLVSLPVRSNMKSKRERPSPQRVPKEAKARAIISKSWPTRSWRPS